MPLGASMCLARPPVAGIESRHGRIRHRRNRRHRSGAIRAVQGGRFLVRGGELVVLEGDWQPPRLVMLEFEDLEAARRWYASEAYQEAKKLREGAASFRAIAVQGID